MPAFNEQGRITGVIKGVKKYKLPLVIVDDGSTDSTYSIARKYTKYVLRHRINLGKGAALKTACEAAFSLGAESIIAIDADGQHEPRYIPDFKAELEKGKEMVFGTRKLRTGTPFIRLMGNKVGSFIVWVLFGIKRRDLLCGFIALSKRAYTLLAWESTGYGLETELAAKTALRNLTHSEVLVSNIYLDKYKGVSILDALVILPSVLKWRLLG